MTAPHDLDRQLQAFLTDGPTELPDPSFDAVRDRMETTRQRVVIGPWRMPDMNRFVPIGLGAAAVVLVAVVGAQLLPGAHGGVGVAPSPSPSALPSAVPSPSSTPDQGLFVLQHPVGGPSITVTLPGPGWVGDVSAGVLVGNNGGDPPDGAAIIGPFFGELYVYGDPCRWSTTVPKAPATTVDEVVTALTAQASRDASAPVEITVDGYAGKSVTLHVPDDAVFGDCDDDKFASWAAGGERLSDGPSRHHQGPGQIDELWIMDVDGELIVVDAMYGAKTSADHLAELHAILQSMTFE